MHHKHEHEFSSLKGMKSVLKIKQPFRPCLVWQKVFQYVFLLGKLKETKAYCLQN